MPAMPPLVQRPSANYSNIPIAHDLVVVHRTEGSYAGSIAWLCGREANASAHLVMKADGSEVSQLVPLSLKAWAQCAFNGRAISLEIEGFTAQGLHDATAVAAAAPVEAPAAEAPVVDAPVVAAPVVDAVAGEETAAE